MEELTILLSIVWGILCLMLFFKIWGACNAIKRLADKYAPEFESEKIKAKNERNKKKDGRLETKEDIEKWLKEENED